MEVAVVMCKASSQSPSSNIPMFNSLQVGCYSCQPPSQQYQSTEGKMTAFISECSSGCKLLRNADEIIIRSRYRLCWQISFKLRSSFCIRCHDRPSSSTSSVKFDSLLLAADSCSSCFSTASGSRLLSPLPDTSKTRREF